ncbi:alkaline phosphatase family protein [Leucobacter sp. G161]|uniref:alkaline phosphatase family protein n=1 Tax=Leucobacter sp. G161 TaxID=663704 RepID=UPI001F1A655C|nr:alkaline phosphatase family protein [Leucobacter sp. G161]
MKKHSMAVAAAALLLGATGVGGAVASPAQADTPAAEGAKTPKTLVVGIDGASFDIMSPESTPTVTAIRNGGLTGTSNLPGNPMAPTVSGPGWSTIATGTWPTKHNVVNNNFTNPQYDKFPDYLTRVEQNLPDRSTNVVGTWGPISTTIFGAAVDSRAQFANDTLTTQAAVETLAAPATDDLFVHLDEVDGAGHGSGATSQAYREALLKADGQIAQMVETIKSRASYHSEDWMIVITSDHGHKPTGGHGDSTKLERKTFVAAQGSHFAPGTERHDVKISDIAPSVLSHIGIANDPAWELDGSVIHDIQPDDFDSLRPLLQPAVQEQGPENLLGWTNTAPEGWSIDNSKMPSGGAPEFSGWTFMTDDFFSNVELGQYRENNVHSRNVFAVADSDEWADVSPKGGNTFDSTLKSPAYELNGSEKLDISFVSDYAVDDPQKAIVWVAFDEASGIAPHELVTYQPEGSRLNPVNRVERFTLDLPRGENGELPQTASLHFEYAATNAAFWVIDQVRVSQADVPAAPAEFALSGTTVEAGKPLTATGTGFAAHEELAFELRSAPQALGTTNADEAGAFSHELTIPATTPAGEHTVVAVRADGTELSQPVSVTAAPSTGGENPGEEKPGEEKPGEEKPDAEKDPAAKDPAASEQPDLAATGGSIAGIAIAATAILGAGAYLVVRSRRRVTE